MKLTSGVKQDERRQRALSRLEAQLKSNVKKLSKKTFNNLDGEKYHIDKVSLSDKDVKRIKREIEILKERV